MFGDITDNKELEDNLTKIKLAEIEEEETHYTDVVIPDNNDTVRNDKDVYHSTCMDCWYYREDNGKIGFIKDYCTVHKETIYDVKLYAFGCSDFSMNGL